MATFVTDCKRYITMVAKFQDLNDPSLQRWLYICIVEQWKKSMGYCFVAKCNRASESHTVHVSFFVFAAIFAGPRILEIQKLLLSTGFACTLKVLENCSQCWILVLTLSNPYSQVPKKSKLHRKTFRIKLPMLWKN